MTFDQLRIFIAVAEREHVTQAAAALNMTQSATSAAISALEERHAVQLFDRIGRRIILTDAGRIFLDEARALLARAQQAEQVLDDLAGLKRGTLRLGASQTVATYWLPLLMQQFRKQYPGLALELITGNTSQVTTMVHDAIVDLGFVEGTVSDPALSKQSLRGDELALVVAPGHQWIEQPPRKANDFLKSAWILREPGSGTRAIADAFFASHRISALDLELTLELPSNEAVRAAVEAGDSATILSTLVTQASLEAGRLVRVNCNLPARQFHVLWHRERRLTKAEQRLMKISGIDHA
ncbi:LysR family transcriptional regulator [Qingshengfaniella alkalisoli]|uniref:LysR family transcriptional regulator n=1 Tax=Qingshengfaniella alkalisoli TaxID=2599296 RepID=A0A5B8IBK2_9RHOB|nr:LysR family transcriptional regulator [Qingshengfaniella alkalisoli]QDY71609.1 LysR family transcriptional regulator [Qingshengfaniella alkalisoli]